MKRLSILTGVLLLVVVVVLTGTKLASAHDFRRGNNVTVGQSEAIHNSLFAAGRNVDINGEVFGDVFCAGQNVTVAGTVHGDVICAGQTVDVTGKVDGDLRLAGQTVTVGAQVTGNATVAGQTFSLSSAGAIGGDLTIGSADATLNGSVGRDVATGGNNLTVANMVGRNIKGSLRSLNLGAGARVQGDIDFTSNNDLNKADGAVVTGKVTRHQPTHHAGRSKRGALFGFGIMWFVYCYLAMLVVAMALALLVPRALQSTSERALPRPWKPLLTGFLASLAAPVLLVILAITVIGLPLAFILGLSWLVVLLLSGPFFGYYLGRLLLRESRQPLLIMFVGASVLLVLYFVPIVGFLALLVTLWTGAGMLLLEIFHRTPKPRYTLATPTPKRRS